MFKLFSARTSRALSLYFNRSPILRPSLPFPLQTTFNFSKHSFSTSKLTPQSDQELNSIRVMCLLQDGEKFLQAMNYPECQKRYEEALDISIKELGASSKESGLSMNCLGQLVHIRGDMFKALNLYGQALDILSENPKENRILLASINNNLSVIYTSLRDFERVIEHLGEAAGFLDQSNSLEAQQKADIYGRMGAIYLHQEKYTEAKEFFLKAVGLLKKVQRRDNTNLGKIYLELGDICEKEGDWDQAVGFREKGVEELEGLNGCGSLLIPTLESLVDFYKEEKVYEKFFENSIKLMHFLGLSTNLNSQVKTVAILRKVGDVYGELGQDQKSVDAYLEAIGVYGELEEKKNVKMKDVLGLYWKLGKALRKVNRGKEAVEYLKAGVEIGEAQGGKEMREQADIYKELGGLYQEMEKKTKAVSYYKKALGVYQVNEEDYHREIGELEKVIESLKGEKEGK